MSAMVNLTPKFSSAIQHFVNSIKREIGHLCHDERRPKAAEKQTLTPAPGDGAIDMTRTFAPGEFPGAIFSGYLLLKDLQ
jgi:hypothetical protein